MGLSPQASDWDGRNTHALASFDLAHRAQNFPPLGFQVGSRVQHGVKVRLQTIANAPKPASASARD